MLTKSISVTLISNLRGSALPADPKIQKHAKENHQTLVNFEGFKPNRLQIRIQRKELRILIPVKIDFDDFFAFYDFQRLNP